jgi:hypothetical protein
MCLMMVTARELLDFPRQSAASKVLSSLAYAQHGAVP